VQLATIQALVTYWGTGYDWRTCEAQLNALPQFVTEIDGLDIHFIHVKSRHEGALPLIITHGWPRSVIKLHQPLNETEEAHMAVTTESSPDAVAIRPFRVEIPEQALDDLRRRIAATRWPSKELVTDRSQGVQLATLRELAATGRPGTTGARARPG
jgi:hypothetical protein